MNKLGHFEENLLAELRQVVAEQAVAPAPVRPRRRLVLAAAGAGVLAVALVFGIPAMGGDRTTAAHAVTNNDDGSVTITVNRLEDPDGLERELAAHGITADVSFAPPGRMCRPVPERYDLAREPPGRERAGRTLRTGGHPRRVTPASTEDSHAGHRLVHGRTEQQDTPFSRRGSARCWLVGTEPRRIRWDTWHCAIPDTQCDRAPAGGSP